MRKVQQQPNCSDFAVAYPTEWLKSGRNLDLCLLAVCSCVLTLLCHQPTVHLASSTGAMRTPVPTTANIDFAIKAGLFVSSKSEDAELAE